MNQERHKHLFAMCQCGKVKFEAVGPPILTGSCYCTSCQEAGRQFEQLASAPPVLDPDSGTGLILYRKDRVQCMVGQQYLEEHRLKPDSPTRRVIAKCCNSYAMTIPDYLAIGLLLMMLLAAARWFAQRKFEL